MPRLTALPLIIRTLFNTLPYSFRYRHRLFLQWAIILHIVAPGSKTCANMARFAPTTITDRDFRNLLDAGYWCVKVVLYYLATCAIATFPPAADGVLYVVGDGSHKEKRSRKNPFAQYGKMNKNTAYFFGIKFVVLMIHWNTYRTDTDRIIALE